MQEDQKEYFELLNSLPLCTCWTTPYIVLSILFFGVGMFVTQNLPYLGPVIGIPLTLMFPILMVHKYYCIKINFPRAIALAALLNRDFAEDMRQCEFGETINEQSKKKEE